MRKILFFLALIVLTSFKGKDAPNYVTFTAEISNPNSDALYIIRNKVVVKKLVLDKQGFVKDTLKVKDGFFELFDGAEYTDLYLKNGYDLKLKLDAKKFDESIVYQGNGANENNYLAESIRLEEKAGNEIANLKPEEVAQFISKRKDSENQRLENKGFDTAFVEGRKKKLAAELVEMQMYFTQKAEAGKMNNTVSPSFNYENYKGGKTKLEDLRGKYVYIDTWATWCGPCRAEIPFLQKIEKKYEGKNIEFVSISVDVKKDYEKWRKFVADKSLGGLQLFADNDWNSEFIRAYGINSIPRFILIDPKGTIIASDAARPSDPNLASQLDQLLK